jgi:hypothetical protein
MGFGTGTFGKSISPDDLPHLGGLWSVSMLSRVSAGYRILPRERSEHTTYLTPTTRVITLLT